MTSQPQAVRRGRPRRIHPYVASWRQVGLRQLRLILASRSHPTVPIARAPGLSIPAQTSRKSVWAAHPQIGAQLKVDFKKDPVETTQKHREGSALESWDATIPGTQLGEQLPQTPSLTSVEGQDLVSQERPTPSEQYRQAPRPVLWRPQETEPIVSAPENSWKTLGEQVADSLSPERTPISEVLGETRQAVDGGLSSGSWTGMQQ